MNVLLWPSLYEWLTRSVPGVRVIQRDQDGRLPDRPFVAAKVIAESREGEPQVGELREDGLGLIQQGALFTVSVHSFGPGAYAIAHDIVNGLNRITIQDLLRSRGMCYVRVLAGPTDLAAIVGTGFEGRAHLDVQMRANVAILDDVGIIERVELTGTVDSFTFTKTIGV